MAERDQFGGLFRRHDPGNAGNAEHVALFMAAFHDQCECLRLHADPALGDGDPVCGRLVADIDHVSLALAVEMCESGHVCCDPVTGMPYNMIKPEAQANPGMSITVRYFAVLREQHGRSTDVIEHQPGMTVADVWQRAVGADMPPANLMVAVNMEYRRRDTPVQDGDEVAFFPAVTGG